jgi:hypothetical protein
MKPLAIDLYCGLGGWSDGLLAEGYDVIGFDIEQHVYGEHHYPAQLVLQDVRTLHGRQFKNAALIVASPPCQGYSYRAMPWKRAKALPPPSNELFDACFRIQREACEAAGRHVPLVVENVRGAQPFVGRARWNFGSFYLWGDVPALMPMTKAIKNGGGSWFAVAHNTTSGHGQNPDGRKVPGIKLSNVGFNVAAAQRYRAEQGIKFHASGPLWFDSGYVDKMLGSKGPASYASRSDSRKAASALIAKIPFPLARHIAAVWRPA